MSRAVAPTEYPALPEGASYWSRSLKRRGSVFHAHTLGVPVCGAKLLIDRHQSVVAKNLGDFRYYGCCPRCFKLSSKALGEQA